MEVGWKEGQWAVTEKTRGRGLELDRVGEAGERDLALQDLAGQSKDFHFQFSDQWETVKGAPGGAVCLIRLVFSVCGGYVVLTCSALLALRGHHSCCLADLLSIWLISGLPHYTPGSLRAETVSLFFICHFIYSILHSRDSGKTG